LKGTEVLRKDHEHVKRLEKIVSKASQSVYDGADIPILHLEKIILVISEFLDAIHYSREENSYFPCVGVNGDFARMIRNFMVEHQFGKNIAFQISKHLKRWKAGEDAREPVGRFLRTYAIYLQDHLSKEDKFFDEAEKALTADEEKEMYEYFSSVIATTKKIDLVLKEIDYLESTYWFRH
jgi:hemerythrin-like domain-containing protein